MGVFGIIAIVQPIGSSLVFVGFLIFLVLLDIGFERLEILAERHEFTLLFEKLKKELMFLGIISFIVFIFESTANPGDSKFLHDILLDFEMTHIIILFMALAFIFQGIFLVNYASTSGKRYINALRSTSQGLIKKYKRLPKKSYGYWWFHFGPRLLPAFPAFRRDIEYKIIERLFIFQHKLSPEFDFANYVNELFMVCERIIDYSSDLLIALY